MQIGKKDLGIHELMDIAEGLSHNLTLEDLDMRNSTSHHLPLVQVLGTGLL